MAADARFIEEDKQFTGRYSRDVLRTVAFAYGPYLRLVAALFALGLCARALLLFTANVMGYWADALCTGNACKPVPKAFSGFGHSDYLAALLALAVVGFILNTIFRVAVARTGTHAVSRLYDEVTYRTSRLPMGFFDRTPVGRIVSRFSSDYGGVFRMAGGPMGEFLCLVFDLGLMLVLTVVASPYYLPLVVATVALNALVYKVNQARLRTERRAVSVTRAPAIAHFAETAQGARTIRAFGKQGSFEQRYGQLVGTFLGQRMRTQLLVQGFAVQMTGLTGFLLLITGLAGLMLLRMNLVSIGSLAVAFTFVMMTSSTIQQFFEQLAQLDEALTGVERLDDYLRRDLERGARLPRAAAFGGVAPEIRRVPGRSDAPRPGGLSGRASASLSCEDLVLRYRPDLPAVLDGVTFRVAAGERLAVVGRTGSGKSSLIQALFLLYPLEKGRILINGRTPAFLEDGGDPGNAGSRDGLGLDEFRAQMALIPQEPTLFRGTLRENLCARASVPDADLRSAVARVGLGEWLSTLSTGASDALDFQVLERGLNLSAGQRQLICMARCLLQDTPIVIMDEATSAVDPETERLLAVAARDALRDKTQIIVAHRLSTIEHCDRVLWLEKGRVVMIGTPEDVLPRFKEARLAGDRGGDPLASAAGGSLDGDGQIASAVQSSLALV